MKTFLKILFIYIPSLIIILIIVLFIILSTNFGLTKIVLPVAGNLAGFPISASSAKLNIFKTSLEIKDLKAGSFLTSEEASCSLNLYDLFLKDTLLIRSFTIKNADIRFEETRKGQWNADFMNETSAPLEPKQEIPPAQPMALFLDLEKVKLENINFCYKDSSGRYISVKNFSLLSDSFKTNTESKLSLEAKLQLDAGENVKISSADLQTALTCKIDKNFIPYFMNLKMDIGHFDGNVSNIDFSDKGVSLYALLDQKDDNTINISAISLKSFSGDTVKSNLNISGTTVIQPFKINLNIDADPIGADVANLLSNTLYSYNLGDSASIDIVGHVDYSEDKLFTQGDITITNAQMDLPEQKEKNQKKKLLNATLKFDANTDFAAKQANVQLFRLDTALNKDNLFNLSIEKPLFLDWSKKRLSSNGLLPEIKLRTNNLDLGIFKEFLPANTSVSGLLSTDAALRLNFDKDIFNLAGNIDISKASYSAPEIKLENFEVHNIVNLSLKNMNEISINKISLSLNRNNAKFSDISLTGNYFFNDSKAALTLQVPEIKPELISFLSPSLIPAESIPILENSLKDLTPSIQIKTLFNSKESDKLELNALSMMIFLNDNGKLAVAINSPLTLNLASKDSILEQNANLNISINNLNMALLNCLIPKENNFAINNGVLNADAEFSLDKKNFDITGKVNGKASNLKITSNTETFDKIDFSLASQLSMKNSGALSISNLNSDLVYDGRNALSFDGSCSFLSNDKDDFSIDTTLSANKALLEALNLGGKETQNIGSFELRGSLKAKSADNEISVVSDLNLPTLVIVNPENNYASQQLNGKISFSLDKNDAQIELHKAQVLLFDKKTTLFDLNSFGNIFLNSEKESKLDITSKRIALKEILDIYNVIFPDNKTRQPQPDSSGAAKPAIPETEPEAINLKGINLVSNITFETIDYGPEITSDLSAVMIIKNNRITIDPFDFSINGAKGKMYFFLDHSFSDGYVYEYKEVIENLDINPFLKTFIEGTYSNTKGNIKNFNIQLKGKGFTTESVNRNLQGLINLNANNITLPYQITQNRILALLILPLRIIADIIDYIPSAQIPTSLTSISNITETMINQEQNISFERGIVNLTISGGKVMVDKFDFQGLPNQFLKYITATGVVGFDSSMNLKTMTCASSLDIPLTIGGTIDNPKPNIPLFITGFLTQNTANLLKGSDVDTLLQNPAQGVKNILQSGSQNIFNNFLGK